MKNDVSAWIIHWLQIRNPEIEIESSVNFYDHGYMDSFGVIELIEAIEAHFKIQLTQSDLKNSAFTTVDGLSAIIIAKLT